MFQFHFSLYIVQLPGASQASVKVLLALLGTFGIDTQTEQQTNSGVYRVASATNKYKIQLNQYVFFFFKGALGNFG